MFQCIICNEDVGVERPADMITVENHPCCNCECGKRIYSDAYDLPISRLVRREYTVMDRMIKILQKKNPKVFAFDIYFCSLDECSTKLLCSGVIDEQGKFYIPWNRLRNKIINTHSIETIVGSYIMVCSKFSKIQTQKEVMNV